MEEINQKLTLDRPAAYQIKVPGVVGEMCLDWVEGMTFTLEGGEGDAPVSTLTVTVDQAGLQGLLRRLYSLGLPLISVVCIEVA